MFSFQCCKNNGNYNTSKIMVDGEWKGGWPEYGYNLDEEL
jgi:hypothetical protein